MRWPSVAGVAGYPILDVGAWDVARPEPEGRSGKVWLTEPGAIVGSRERDWLFKPVVVHANGSGRVAIGQRRSSASSAAFWAFTVPRSALLAGGDEPEEAAR